MLRDLTLDLFCSMKLPFTSFLAYPIEHVFGKAVCQNLWPFMSRKQSSDGAHTAEFTRRRNFESLKLPKLRLFFSIAFGFLDLVL